MRILILTSWATDVIGGSGTAVFFNSFLGGLRARGYDVDIIAPNYDTTDYVDVTLKRFLFNAELRTDPRINQADLIIGFDYDGYALDPKTRPPMIVSAHALFGDVLPWESGEVRTMVRAQAFFDQASMERADWVIAASHYAKRRIVDLYHIEPTKIEVIHHGLSRPSWMNHLSNEPLPVNDHPIILAVGKMYPRKRVDLLLQAVPLLLEKYPTLEVRIVGNGLEWKKMHEVANSLGINEHITWLSHVTDDKAFAREWQQADVFCHPSSQESFGYVYLEAMAVGKAIVAADNSAGPEVIGDAGLLVEAENPAAFASGISQLLGNPVLRAAMGAKGKTRINQFTLDKMLDRYEKAIQEVASRRSAPLTVDQ
jgi:glycosyltransferase involved in cell wall biosynthesis